MSFKKLNERSKGLTISICFLMLWFLLPIAIKRTTCNLLYEFEAPFWSLAAHIKDIQTYWSLKLHTKHQLMEAIRDLTRLNAAYELNITKAETLETEQSRLEALLNLPSFAQYSYEYARVQHRELSAWWQQIILDKGTNYNIPVGAGVIFSGGVVGKVSAVHATTCTVDLITSPHFRSVCHIKGDLQPIVYRGSIGSAYTPPVGLAEYIPLDLELTSNVPICLVSSKLGGVFPDGLIFGYLQNIHILPNGLAQNAQVQLDKRLRTLREVAILMPLENQVP